MQTGSVVDSFYYDEVTIEPGFFQPYVYGEKAITEAGGTVFGDLAYMGNAKEVAAAVTLDVSHAVVNVDTSGGTRVVTLPDCNTFAGKNYLIRRDGSNTVTINRAGSDTFDDAATSKSLDTDGAAIGIFSIGDGEWKIVGTQGTVT